MKNLLLLIGMVLCAISSIGQTTNVTFKVNMNHQISNGSFSPSADNLDIAGSFISWDEGCQLSLIDTDSDGIYETSRSLNIGDMIEFKTRINCNWSGTEEFSGGGPNRSYTVEENGVLEYWYNDELPDTVLQVAFSASSLNNIPGEAIQFLDQSKGDPVSWEWSFPGGTPSTSDEQNPIVSYADEGRYDVSLTVTNEKGQTETKTVEEYITVGLRETFWWNDAVFYEIFVRSFYDSDGDGIGDFQGIIEKLDYLNDGNPETYSDLGVTGIWLMPIHQSPSYHGYDVTNYREIESDYGTNEDFKEFMAEAHKRGIHVIIDYVMNHSSTEHPWFQFSLDASSAYRNWFRWEDNNPGGNGPWGQQVWHQRNGDYYYGLFWGGMPDLNYETEAVKTEMFDIADYWLTEMEVDGFRLDAVKYIYEDGRELEDTEETFDFWKEFRTHYKSINPNSFSVGEAWTSTDKVKKYVENGGLDFCFDFDLANAILNSVISEDNTNLINQMNNVMSAYPYIQFGTFLTNHDINRVMNVLDEDEGRARVASELLLTLPGIPFIYYGEEIGQLGVKPDEDIRRPLQWNDESAAGFTTGSPWRAPFSDYREKNIDSQYYDQESLWRNYQRLITTRNQQPALRNGDYQSVTSSDNEIFSFIRYIDDEIVLVVSNLSNDEKSDFELSIDFSKLQDGAYTMTDLHSGFGFRIDISNGSFSSNSSQTLEAKSTNIFKAIPYDEEAQFEVLFKLDLNEDARLQGTSQDVRIHFGQNLEEFGTKMTDSNSDGIYEYSIPNIYLGIQLDYFYSVGDQSDGFVRRYFVHDGDNIILDKMRNETLLSNEPITQPGFDLYPNPVANQIRLAHTSANSNYQISDLGGKVAKAGVIDGNRINVQNLKKGLYIIEINSGNDIFIRKFVKQ